MSTIGQSAAEIEQLQDEFNNRVTEIEKLQQELEMERQAHNVRSVNN